MTTQTPNSPFLWHVARKPSIMVDEPDGRSRSQRQADVLEAARMQGGSQELVYGRPPALRKRKASPPTKPRRGTVNAYSFAVPTP